MVYEEYLGEETAHKKEAKYNLFKFQDYLLDLINVSSQHFTNRNYPAAVEHMTVIYTDMIGYIDQKDQGKVETEWKTLLQTLKAYEEYNKSWNNRTPYQPPMNVYNAYITLRISLMRIMAEKQLLIPQIKKGVTGAADN